MSLISIIIPVRNAEDTLPDCMESVLAQTSVGYEVLLAEGGSGDGSPELCDRYAAAHPELIRALHLGGTGAGDARNAGLDAARGDYCLFADPADTVSAELVETLLPFTRSGTDLVIFAAALGGAPERDAPRRADGYPEEQELTASLFPQVFLGLPDACLRMYKKSLFTKSGVRFPNDDSWGDLRTVTKLYPFAESIRYTDRALYRYRSDPDASSKRTTVSRCLEVTGAFDDILAFYRDRGLYERYAEELEYLALSRLLVDISGRIARADPASPVLGRVYVWMRRNFPDAGSNRYLSGMPGWKRRAYRLASRRSYRLLSLFMRLRG